MDREKYLEDLKDIREMMNKSSRFISLSGFSGISAGISALLGVYFVYTEIYTDQDYFAYRKVFITEETIWSLLGIAIVTLAVSLGTGVFFTTRKARRENQKIWDHQTKRLLINLLIPLATGGILSLILLLKGFVGLIAPLTLIFYGLALVNASKFTLSEIRSLGLIEIILGLISMYFIGYGLFFWAIGFGVLHVIYGVVMQVKYKS